MHRRLDYRIRSCQLEGGIDRRPEQAVSSVDNAGYSTQFEDASAIASRL